MYHREQNYTFFGVLQMKQSDLSALKACVLLKGLSEIQLKKMLTSNTFSLKTYKKNENIFTPQEYLKSLAIILSGSASVYKSTEKGELLMSVLTPGAVFGMSALFYEEKGFLTTVKTRNNCRVLFISKEQLAALFRDFPQTAENYITVLSERIHYLNSKIDRLTAVSPSQKLLSFLEETSIKTGQESFCLPISLSELANTLSIGRTSLYRAFDELESEKKIVKNGKTFRLIK